VLQTAKPAATAALDAACRSCWPAAVVAAYAAGLHNYLSLNAIADNRDSLIGVRQRQQFCCRDRPVPA
jgi:hypothetical protein